MAKFILYHYDPSTPAAVVFITLFAITTLLHTFQMMKTKTWYFIPFVLGGVFETIGYTGRAISSTQSPNFTTGPYICQSLLLLLAPALLAASIYMVLSRLIKLVHGERYSMISTRWLTGLFVSGDVLSFLTQSGGGALLARAKTNSQIKTGERVIMGGLGIQILFMNLFILVTFVFHRRISRHPTARSKRLTVPWRGMLVLLYVVSALIAARSGFRIVEYMQGNEGFLMKHEVFLYVFDGSLMWIVMWVCNVWHPSQVFRRGGRRRRRSREGSDGHHRSRRGRHHGQSLSYDSRDGSDRHHRSRRGHEQSRSHSSRDVESQLEYPGAIHSKH